MFDALVHKYQSQMLESEASLMVYFTSPVGIGEHPQHLEEMDKLVEKIANARANKDYQAIQDIAKKFVRKDLGMTGELTLTGKVLPVGGIKEKLIAAKREKLKILILPSENERDLHELSSTLKKSFKLYFVNDYIQIYSIIFFNLNKILVIQILKNNLFQFIFRD